MATVAIAFTATIIAPERIAKVESAGIGGSTDHGAADRADGRTGTGITHGRADRGAARRADQTAGYRAVARRVTATRKQQCGGKSHHKSMRAHDVTPVILPS